MAEAVVMLGVGMLAASLLLLLFPRGDGGLSATYAAISRQARRERSASTGRRVALAGIAAGALIALGGWLMSSG
jgi:hypothetical protein